MLEGRLQQAYRCGEWWWWIHSWISGYAKLTSIRSSNSDLKLVCFGIKKEFCLTFGQGTLYLILSYENQVVANFAPARNRPIPRSVSEVTTSILHSTRSSLWQDPFPQCNTSDVLEWWGFNLWWISLWDSSWISWLVRGPVYTLGFLLTSGEGQSNAHDFCDAFDQLRDKVVRGEILCVL